MADSPTAFSSVSRYQGDFVMYRFKEGVTILVNIHSVIHVFMFLYRINFP